MGLRIRTNIASINAQRLLGETTKEAQRVMTQLSSGKRINRAADDAAGLGVSENLKASIRSLVQARRNANDGVSLVQTAEGGLEETSNMLIRMRELAINAASDTVGDKERNYIQMEFGALKDEMDRIAASVEFNGTRLLVGNRENTPRGMTFDNDNVFPLQVQINKDYHEGIDSIENDNPINNIKIDLTKIDAFAEGLGIGKNGGKGEAKLITRSEAQRAISRIDGALNTVNGYRSYLGANQNRLNATIRDLERQVENLTQSESQIVDVDFAEATAQYTQVSILQNAGVSVLSKTNTMPQVALALLNNS